MTSVGYKGRPQSSNTFNSAESANGKGAESWPPASRKALTRLSCVWNSRPRLHIVQPHVRDAVIFRVLPLCNKVRGEAGACWVEEGNTSIFA